MIKELLITVVFLFFSILWLMYITTTHQSSSLYDSIFELDDLKAYVSQVCRKAGYHNPEYTLQQVSYATGTYTYFVQGYIPSICLCMKNRDGVKYSSHKIREVLLHEVAHILCSDTGHTPLFNSIESRLLQASVQLGYTVNSEYSINNDVDYDYPCVHD